MNRKQRIIVSITGIFIVLLALVGLTYAYFLTRITGNSNDKSIEITTANLSVTYNDDMDGDGEPDALMVFENIIPSNTTTYTKTFKVENTGNATATYSVVLDNMVNEFERNQDLKYTLTRDGVEGNVAEGNLVVGTKQILIPKVEIEDDRIHTYTLTLKYIDPGIDQSIDMGKELSFKVNIDAEQNSWDNPKSGTLLAAIKENKGRYLVVDNMVTLPNLDATMDNCDNGYLFGHSYTMDPNTGKFSINDLEIKDKYEVATAYNMFSASAEMVCASSDETENIEMMQNLTTIYKIEAMGINLPSDNIITLNGVHELTTTREETTIGEPLTIPGRDIPLENEAVLAEAEDDYGISHYFRGNVTNNYVNFNNMCWRIVRIQGDGSIKLIMVDSKNTCDSPNLKIFGTPNNYINAYFSGSTNSPHNLKFTETEADDTLETWFSNTISAENKEKLTLTDWCNDVSIYSVDEKDNNIVITNGFSRLDDKTTATPTLKCNMTGLNNSKAIRYNSKIALITADEIAFTDIRPENYSSDLFTMTPRHTRYTKDGPWGDYEVNLFRGVQKGGSDILSYLPQTIAYGLFPTITLNNNIKVISGTGYIDNPYVI